MSFSICWWASWREGTRNCWGSPPCRIDSFAGSCGSNVSSFKFLRNHNDALVIKNLLGGFETLVETSMNFARYLNDPPSCVFSGAWQFLERKIKVCALLKMQTHGGLQQRTFGSKCLPFLGMEPRTLYFLLNLGLCTTERTSEESDPIWWLPTKETLCPKKLPFLGIEPWTIFCWILACLYRNVQDVEWNTKVVRRFYFPIVWISRDQNHPGSNPGPSSVERFALLTELYLKIEAENSVAQNGVFLSSHRWGLFAANGKS